MVVLITSRKEAEAHEMDINTKRGEELEAILHRRKNQTGNS
jgi:hypothetical protein